MFEQVVLIAYNYCMFKQIGRVPIKDKLKKLLKYPFQKGAIDRITRGTKKPESKAADVCEDYMKLHEAYQVWNILMEEHVLDANAGKQLS